MALDAESTEILDPLVKPEDDENYRHCETLVAAVSCVDCFTSFAMTEEGVLNDAVPVIPHLMRNPQTATS